MSRPSRPRRLGIAVGALLAASCAGVRPADLGVAASRLAPCPASPNCVSSDAEDAGHAIAPLRLAVAPARGWRAAVEAVRELPRVRIVVETATYLHAECTSALMRYVDDLELHLRSADRLIAVRSASRVGHGDMGVNRARVEQLRAALAGAGVLEQVGERGARGQERAKR